MSPHPAAGKWHTATTPIGMVFSTNPSGLVQWQPLGSGQRKTDTEIKEGLSCFWRLHSTLIPPNHSILTWPSHPHEARACQGLLQSRSSATRNSVDAAPSPALTLGSSSSSYLSGTVLPLTLCWSHWQLRKSLVDRWVMSPSQAPACSQLSGIVTQHNKAEDSRKFLHFPDYLCEKRGIGFARILPGPYPLTLDYMILWWSANTHVWSHTGLVDSLSFGHSQYGRHNALAVRRSKLGSPQITWASLFFIGLTIKKL